MGGGVYQDRNVFKRRVRAVHVPGKVDKAGQGGRADFRFPDQRRAYKTGSTIERVDGPAPFDLKLTLDRSPRGPRVYYSVEAQTGDLDSFLAAHAPAAAE